MNCDLFAFLSLVSSTLITLHIVNSPIHRPSDEEYALDAVVPNMVALESVYVDGGMASSLVVARKRKGTQNRAQGLNRRSKITICGTSFLPDSTSLIEALQVSSWGSVTIRQPFSTLFDKDLKMRASVAAKKEESLCISPKSIRDNLMSFHCDILSNCDQGKIYCSLT